jgi:hypothetical protein
MSTSGPATGEHTARFLSTRTDSIWRDVSAAADAGDEARRAADVAGDALDRFTSEVLLAENLVVLCGLGSTRSAKDHGGHEVAPSMSDLWAAAEAKAGADFSKICAEAKYKKIGPADNIEILLSACQLATAFSESGSLTTFISETEALIVSRCRFVNGNTDLSTHETFLRKVARRSTRQPRLKLFTTNYDLCFEAAANRIHFVVVDGFSHTNPQEFDGSYFGYDFVRREQDRESPDYIPNVFHLYKLHGSVDWELHERLIRRSAAPSKPLIIYPRHSKFELSYDQPFLEMMSRFQLGLRQPNTGLLVVGFGFNDFHIAQPILSAIRSNVGLRCLIVDPALEASTNEYLTEFAQLAQSGDHRLGLLSGTFQEFVPRIPDLVAETEAELHRKRLLKVKAVP